MNRHKFAALYIPPIVLAAFILGPIIAGHLQPRYAPLLIGLQEAFFEITLLYGFLFRSERNWSLIAAATFLFVADSTYSMISIYPSLNSLALRTFSEVAYSGFVLALTKLLFDLFRSIPKRLLLPESMFFIVTIALNIYFIAIPVTRSAYSSDLIMYNGILYALTQGLVLALALSCALYSANIYASTIFQAVTFMAISDFAIRYRSFNNGSFYDFSVFEFGWQLSIGIIWWILLFNRKRLDFTDWFEANSFKPTLTLIIFGANTVLLGAIYLFGLHEVGNAQKLSLILMLVFSVWLTANYAGIYVTDKIKDTFHVFAENSRSNTSFDERRSASELREIKSGIGIWELDTIFAFYNDILIKLRSSIESLIHQAEVRESARLARQVAHDIRSPLSALQMVLFADNALSTDKRDFAKQALKRIQNIANDLLEKNKIKELTANRNLQFGVERSDVSTCDLHYESRLIIEEKRLQIPTAKQIEIRLIRTHEAGPLAKICPNAFGRVLSNLITNSCEAILTEGFVQITIEMKDTLIVKVADNGRGMPTEIVDRLGTEGFSYGKTDSKSGSGIGLYHAFQVLRNAGGKVEVQSELDVGTTVLLEIPILKEEPKNRSVVPSDSVQRLRI